MRTLTLTDDQVKSLEFLIGYKLTELKDLELPESANNYRKDLNDVYIALNCLA